jgi:hypothetical protein
VQCGRCWKESEGVADRGVGFLEELSWVIFHTEEEGGSDLEKVAMEECDRKEEV